MPERIGAPLFLLARFAEFFEEVEGIKLAIAEGRLGALLTVGDEAPPTRSQDLATRVSSRLAAVLLAQRKSLERVGTPSEIDAHEQALYAMASLADELFILEIDWPGRDAWMDVLLEAKLFHTRNAGVRFFDMAETLLASRSIDALQADVAAVMVLALRLGFKGKYRGEKSHAELRELRARLFRLVERLHGKHEHGVAFPQALTQLQAGGKPRRLAPLTPWFIGAAIVLVIYLIVSSAVWLAAIEPFRQAVERA